MQLEKKWKRQWHADLVNQAARSAGWRESKCNSVRGEVGAAPGSDVAGSW